MNARVHERTDAAVRFVSLARMHYDEAFDLQQTRATSLLRLEDELQTVYAVEHPPTLTIGKSGSRDNILASSEELDRLQMTVRQIDRGGDVTYHGPGQCVLYPVLHLAPWGNGIRQYVEMLEDCAIAAAATAGIRAGRAQGYPGVWVEDRKICAIGVRARRRPSGEFVTTHGLAFNITTDLSHFDTIVPCGLHDRGVTSVQRELGPGVAVDFADWQDRLKQAFAQVFEVSLS